MNEKMDIQTSNKEKRFLPATESFAKARLDNFRSGIKSFQKEHPEVLGATVYGSMIKGDQAKETSDVDAFLYIDKENLPNGEKSKDIDVLESEYRSGFLKSLNISQEEASKYYGDLRPKLLDDQVLNNDINARVEYDNQMKAYKKMLEEKYTYEASDEEKGKLLSQEPQLKNDLAIPGMFHARVGGGIEKYRRLFLDKVNALPDKEMAEKIWKDVCFELKTYEERSDPNKKIEVPQTLNEALRVYHPDLYKSISKKKDEENIFKIKEHLLETFENNEFGEPHIDNPKILDLIAEIEYCTEQGEQKEISIQNWKRGIQKQYEEALKDFKKYNYPGMIYGKGGYDRFMIRDGKVFFKQGEPNPEDPRLKRALELGLKTEAQ